MPQPAQKIQAAPALRKVRSLPKVNIGCGRSPKPTEEGWVNCDLYPGKGVDSVFDAQQRWPFDDESVAEVESYHVLEHLSDPLAFFREAWRVLMPNGQMRLRLPHGWHQSCWWDATHVRPWLEQSFAILQPGFTVYTRNYQHSKMGFAFWVANCTMVFDAPWSRMWRFKPLRPLCRWAGGHLLNVYRDLFVEAYKTTEDDPNSTAFGGTRHPAIVQSSWGVYKHEYYATSPKDLSVVEILIFSGGGGAIAGDGPNK